MFKDEYDRLLSQGANSKENKNNDNKKDADNDDGDTKPPPVLIGGDQYTASEAESAYKYLADHHKKHGWSGWWVRNGQKRWRTCVHCRLAR